MTDHVIHDADYLAFQSDLARLGMPETKDGSSEIEVLLGEINTGVAKFGADLNDLKTKAAKIDKLDDANTQIRRQLEDLEADFARKQSTIEVGGIRATKDQIEHKNAFGEYLRNPQAQPTIAALSEAEQKTASGATGTAGGFAVPELLVPAFLQRSKDGSPMRQLASVFPVSTGNVRLASSNNDASSGWVGENDDRDPTTEPRARQATPTFGMVYARIEATEELVMDSAFPVEDWFTRAAGDEIAKAEGVAFVSGNGTNRPTGLFNQPPEATADFAGRTDGALQYVPSGAAGALTDPDALINLVYTVRAEYRANATWVMNSKTAGTVRRLKDADGRYLWQDGLAAGQPSILAGYPVVIDENMPDIAADTHPIAFGDFMRGYVICDHGGLRITLDDNITTPGKVKWYIRRRVGGAVWDDHAIKVLKIAAS